MSLDSIPQVQAPVMPVQQSLQQMQMLNDAGHG